MEFREDLPYLLNQRGLKGMGVEVGSLRGDFAEHILKYWEGKRLYLVDAWRHISGLVDVNNPDHNGHLDNFARTFMKVYGHMERCVIIRDLSVTAAELFRDKQLDFVYLDAGHDFQSVKEDLEAWYPKVRSGGILAGHDYLDSSKRENGHTDFQVKSAVDAFAATNSLKVDSTPEENYPTWWIDIP